MVPILVDGPAVEPVSVPEMRDYLRLDTDAEDALVADLIRAARLAVEAASRSILIASRWRLALDAWPPDGLVAVPLWPVLAIERIRVAASPASPAADLGPELYRLDLSASGQVRIRIDPRALGAAEPGGITIDVRAGYGADAAAIPASLVQAVRVLVARWFENRGDTAAALPPDVALLVGPHRRPRL